MKRVCAKSAVYNPYATCTTDICIKTNFFRTCLKKIETKTVVRKLIQFPTCLKRDPKSDPEKAKTIQSFEVLNPDLLSTTCTMKCIFMKRIKLTF